MEYHDKLSNNKSWYFKKNYSSFLNSFISSYIIVAQSSIHVNLSELLKIISNNWFLCIHMALLHQVFCMLDDYKCFIVDNNFI